MFKRWLLILLLLSLAAVVAAESSELILSFYVLFPVMLLPLFLILLDETAPKIFFGALTFTGLFYLYHLYRHPHAEMGVLGAGLGIFIAAVLFYKRRWKDLLAKETSAARASREELEALKQKHGSRLESLHHLEKQVAGLLDLFEIARDFNDTLGYGPMAEILLRRVMPQIPFKRLILALSEKPHAGPLAVHRVFSVEDQNILESEGLKALSTDEIRWLETTAAQGKMLQERESFTFPLMMEGRFAAGLIIEGAHEDDLAKFEVLAAYMTLQVKKIQLYETVRELSIHDGLTGVFVRRHFMERFEEELTRSLKHTRPLAVLMLDIDHFKRYNDSHGHLAGDATLKQVAQLLRENLRKVDRVGRYGGEEFVAVIPEAGRTEALEVAERIRSSIARTNFKVFNDQTKVTVSIGISLFPADAAGMLTGESQTAVTESTDLPGAGDNKVPEIALELIRKADDALYQAKEEGRNQVAVHQGQ